MKIFLLFLMNVLFIVSKKIKNFHQRIIVPISDINMNSTTNKGSVYYLPNISNPSSKIGFYNSTCGQSVPIVERGIVVSHNNQMAPYPYVSKTYQPKMILYP